MTTQMQDSALIFHEQNEQIIVDLHGFTAAHAAHEVASAFIEAAWQRGKERITLIHGSPDVTSWRQSIMFRGGIKWALRRELGQGVWRRWVWNRRSSKHTGLDPDSGAMTLALRPNSNRDPSFPWPSVDEPVYDYEGPWHRRND